MTQSDEIISETSEFIYPDSEQIILDCGKIIKTSKIFQPIIRVEDASHFLKIIKAQNDLDSKAVKKMDKNKKKASVPLCITLDSSSEDEAEQSQSSPEYVPSDASPKPSIKSSSSSRGSKSSSTPSLKSISRSNSPMEASSSYKRVRISDSSDNDDDEEDSPKINNKKKKRRIVDDDDDNEDDDEDNEEMEEFDSDNSSNGSDSSGDRKKKKKLRTRKIKSKEDLEKETIDAEEAEKERRLRLAQRQKEFNGIEYETFTTEDGSSLVQKLKQVVLDADSKNENPTPVKVHPALVKVLKPHQAEGIEFMYENAFESLERFRKGDVGGGGILAHCMGLGKTLQVVAFIHTILNHKIMSKKISKILIVVPKNVVLNWKNEFDKWLGPNRLDTFSVYELDSFKEDRDRLMCLRNWKEEDEPAVMIIGYEMFRILTQSQEDRVVKKGRKPPSKPKKLTKKQKKFVKMQEDFRKYLQNPGPDLVVCDEAHKLKNDESLLARTMLKIKTKRRICLTGTPLQNNLNEYYVMVSFVKPNLLGTKAEFANQFANIIERGRTKDASDFEVRLMRKRCFVLFDRLKKVVQRKDISVLKQEIPGKMEYVINVRLTEPQVKLYQIFLDMVDKEGGAELRKRLLSDYYIFSRIWTHPYQLIHHASEMERKEMLTEGYDNFIDDDDDGSLASDSDNNGEVVLKDSDNSDQEAPVITRSTRQSKRLAGEVIPLKSRSPSPLIEFEAATGWWSDIVTPADKYNIEMTNKLLILFDIIKRCEAIGDKLLVFSQSLESLRLIRAYLEEYDKNDKWFVDGHECLASEGEKWGWKRGIDYLVIDGSVQTRDRENIQLRFNKKTNLRARLMLISTRAGSLGTNMVAANRVVIFDSCWNPSHDTQSLFRVYRIGQVKPVYIYRLIAQGTMEECIYKRQVTKDSTAMRVIDEAQIQRHFQNRDLIELYTLGHKPYDENEVYSIAPPKDRLLGELILKNPAAVVNYIFHDNLFENVEGEKLTPQEMSEAWDEYKRDKSNPYAAAAAQNLLNNTTMQMQIQQMQQQIQQQLQQQIQNGGLNISAFGNILNNPTVTIINNVTVDISLSAHILGDAVYGLAVRSGLNRQQATCVTYVKLLLHTLLDKLPSNMKDGVTEFGTIINEIITDDVAPDAKIKRVLDLFTTLSSVFRSFPATNVLLDRYYKSSSWLASFRRIIPRAAAAPPPPAVI